AESRRIKPRSQPAVSSSVSTPANPDTPRMELAMDSRATWTAFANGDLAARDALLTANLSLVHHVARQLERRLSDQLDHGELVSAGTLGLMAALSAFDPSRKIAFSTFAVPYSRCDSRRASPPGPCAALGSPQDARDPGGPFGARR